MFVSFRDKNAVCSIEILVFEVSV